jgi:hypothetical protein
MRRGNNKTEWAAHCCRLYQATAILDGISLLCSRAISWNKPDLTVEDLLRIFVPPHLQQLAVNAYEHLDVDGHRRILYQSETKGLDIAIHINQLAFAAVKKTTVNDCPERVKLDEWVAWRFDRGMEWATVKAVWRGLQKACHVPGTNQLKTVRYLWPTVMTLLEAGGDKKTADKLRDARPPDWVPHLPLELRAAMKVTAGIVAGTLLLPKEERSLEPSRVPMRMHMVGADRVRPVDLGWGEMARPL